MADKNPFIAACGLPEMLVAACNAIGAYAPVKKVEENRLEHLRPEGWIVSADVFTSHLDFLLPYRKHVLIWTPEVLKSRPDSIPQTISTHDPEERWAEALTALEEAGSPFGSDMAPVSLSQREKEVIALIAQGLTAKEIADRLGISANTVVTHRKNLTAKLGIRSTSGLSLYALMNGLI